MTTVRPEDPIAVAAVAAIHEGRVQDLRALLDEHSWLATARLGTTRESRTLLHVATDWPGHYPQVGATIAALVAAGAEVDARFHGPHEETPLHWAASCDDVEAADALLDAGADIEAPGAVLGGGAPIADARGFKQWAVARRLLARGATTTLMDAATLGLDDRVAELLAAEPTPSADEIDLALWGACHGGRRDCAELLVARGADLNRVPPWTEQGPWDAATAEGAHDLAQWLHDRGARSAATD